MTTNYNELRRITMNYDKLRQIATNYDELRQITNSVMVRELDRQSIPDQIMISNQIVIGILMCRMSQDQGVPKYRVSQNPQGVPKSRATPSSGRMQAQYTVHMASSSKVCIQA